jgi:hypothetical protein
MASGKGVLAVPEAVVVAKWVWVPDVLFASVLIVADVVVVLIFLVVLDKVFFESVVYSLLDLYWPWEADAVLSDAVIVALTAVASVYFDSSAVDITPTMTLLWATIIRLLEETLVEWLSPDNSTPVETLDNW